MLSDVENKVRERLAHLCEMLLAEIERLQEATRLSLAIADEHSKENVALRLQAETFERLGEELNRQKAKTEYEAELRGNCLNDLDAAKAENERLQRERDQYMKSAVDYGNLSERLQAALKELSDAIDEATDYINVELGMCSNRVAAARKGAEEALAIEQRAGD